jgi:recombination protein RecA
MAKKKEEGEKSLNIQEVLDNLNKTLKTNVQFANSGKGLDVERIRTGSITFDSSTGGGFPVGRHTCLYGPESSGKTTSALMAVAKYQKTTDGRYALFLDGEFAFDKKYAKALGVDLARLIVVQPDHTNQAQEVLLDLLRKDLIGIFVYDSIAAIQPISVLENDSDASNMGKHALAVGNIFKACNGLVSKNKVCAIWINQIRDKIGSYSGGYSMPGGHAPKFYCSIMIQVNRGTKVDNADGTHTNRGSIYVTKNKTAPPYKKGEYDMEHGSGISVSQEVLDYGVSTKVLYKVANTFYYDETGSNDNSKSAEHIKLGGTKSAAKNMLNDNIELRDILYDKILYVLGSDFNDDELEILEQRD